MKTQKLSRSEQVAAGRAYKFFIGMLLAGVGISVLLTYFSGGYAHSAIAPSEALVGGGIATFLGLRYLFRLRTSGGIAGFMRSLEPNATEQVTPAQARKRFLSNIAWGLFGGAIFVLLLNLAGACDDMPPIAQVIVFGSAALFGLLYLFQHRKPDGTIDWK